MFICNHCPFVKHIADQLAVFGSKAQEMGAAVVAIQSNDILNYPDDAPGKMKEEIETRGYTFPYLHDEEQDIAHAYRAACTPDFFVYDGSRLLRYRGQFDGSRPGNDVPVTGEDLMNALEKVLKGEEIPADEQKPSIGCNIKWKPGNEPEYA
jgi:thiol-disulfide isomerase/thioredoxin